MKTGFNEVIYEVGIENKATCSICDNPILAVGLCRKHYKQNRLVAMPECSVDDCNKPSEVKSLCNTHYGRGRVLLRRCRALNCRSPIRTNGTFCWTHQKLKSSNGRLCVSVFCDLPAVRNGYTICDSHYRTRKLPQCEASDCLSPQKINQLCPAHMRLIVKDMSSFERINHVGIEIISQRVSRLSAKCASGYTVISVEGKRLFVHRVLMMIVLGRDLLPSENVHHINGVRDDNRLDNLELWTVTQPSGQRVSDKIEWAMDLLRFYAPDKLSET